MKIPGYRIDREIGKGGMATVYLAVQESLERPVVLKILDKVQGSNSQDMTQRFIDEGRIIASLHHPNIVTIYDIGLAGEELYISMEYIQGGDLKKRMETHVKPKTALDIIYKIGSALVSAHSHNIIHRDIKPANILFRVDSIPLLTDFGIAKQTNDDKDLTSTGIFLGSPNYVSPEQADGKKVDGRSDIYSLGCVFYEMLTSYKPYHSNSVIDIVIQHKTSPVPTLPNKLSIYQPLLNRMMAKSLNTRFSGAQEMLQSIEKLQMPKNDSDIVPKINITSVTDTKKYKKKKQRKSMMILISLLILSAIFFFGLQFVDIRLKSYDAAVRIDQISTNTVLPGNSDNSINPAEQTIKSIPTPTEPDMVETEAVTRALAWLGKQSLDQYKLTYPEKDNAYYYFSRLLELQPDSRVAYDGILSIAERYAILAERALVNNEIKKTKTYIDIGLQIDPENEALLSLRTLVADQKINFWDTVKSFF